MPLERPTLQQIIDRVRGDIRSGLGINSVLRRTFIGVFGRALAGQSHVLHGNLQFVSEQAFLQTADDDFVLRFAEFYGVQRNPAQQAELTIKITGDVGSIIPDLTSWQNDTGALYTQQGEATIPAFVAGVAEQTLIETVADTSGSLEGKFFFINTPTTEYVVYFRNITSGNGDDPNLTGKTSIQVDYEEDDTANDIAILLAAAIDGASDMSASVSTNEVTVTNDDTGAVETATDVDTTFSFTRLIQGIDQVDVEAIINVLADEAGESGNVDNGESLTLVSAIAGVDSQAEVTATVIEGEDIESIDDLRARVIARVQRPPSGGDVNDYEQQALSVAGITRAWVFPDFFGVGTGTVGVAVVEDNEANIIPDAAKIEEVQTALEARDFKPVTARVTAFAPTPLNMDLVIKLKPNTQAVRDAVTANLKDLIFRDAAPKDAFKGASEVFDGVILLSRIGEAISTAIGEEDHEIVTINGSAPANVEPTTTGELVQLGTITWQPLI